MVPPYLRVKSEYTNKTKKWKYGNVTKPEEPQIPHIKIRSIKVDKSLNWDNI